VLTFLSRGTGAQILPTGAASRAAEAAGDERLSLAAYASALDAIRADLTAGHTAEARRAARQLQGREVAWRDEALATDATVLSAVAEARSEPEARGQAARLERLVRALRAADAAEAPPAEAPQPALLDRLAAPDDAREGGTIPELRLRPVPVPERVVSGLLAARDKLAAAIRSIWKLLRELLLPRGPGPAGDAPGVARAAIAFVAMVLAALVALTIRALRRGGAPAAQVTAPASSSDDEDPISRESAQWETHARELAGARRFREAIRAWYHAVLTALFRRGELHYRKGRTNWEYVASVGPERGWRGEFIALTRLFDREWYGRRSSDREALADAADRAREILAALGGPRGVA
jgi:hypothetical protein